MRQSFDQLVDRYRAEFEAEQATEAAAIADAIAGRGIMPPNYWQARFRAEQRLKAALEVQAAFREAAA